MGGVTNEKGTRVLITVVTPLSPPADCQLADLEEYRTKFHFLSVLAAELLSCVLVYLTSLTSGAPRLQPPVAPRPYGDDVAANARVIEQMLLQGDPSLFGIHF